MKDLAPIVLFVYNRPDHTKKTILSLLKNSVAEKSELFIYSDGPKNEIEEDKIKNVRKYINEISGFKKIEIIESQKNLGLAILLFRVSEVLSKDERVIVMEDDMVCSPFFLEFMNTLLNFYEEDEKVFL